MNKKFLPLLSALICVTGLMEMTYAEIPPTEAYDNKIVASIEITAENLPPESTFDPKTLLSRLKTRTGDPFSQATFDSDLKELAKDYDRIEPKIEVHNGQVYIEIKIWPRPKIRMIRWEGNEHVKTKILQKELGIRPNTLFNQQKFNKAFNKVKEYYIKNGYFESQLQYNLTPDPKTNEVDILISIEEGRAGRIDQIIFKGFTHKEESDLYEMIHTKKYLFLISWMTGGGTYNEEALEQDKITIINYLQNEGYADARVDIQVRGAKTEGKVILEISCEKGPLFHFGKVSFAGNKLFSDEEIQKRILIHEGEIYSPEKIRETAELLKTLYGRKGYIDASIPYEAQLNENEPIYNVHFTIEENEQYKVGLIHVFGNVQTQTHVILRESLLIPGETFDSAKLKRTRERLENIGYFKTVNVYAVRTQEDELLGENYRDVYIEVEETTTGNLSLFGGFSSADSVFGGLDLSETNFNVAGVPRILKHGLAAVRGGGEYAHLRITLGEKQTAYSVSWLNPYFRDTLWRVGIDVSRTFSSLTSDHYSSDTIGGTFYASYPINSLWAFGWKYRLRNEHIHVDHHHTSKKERQQAHNSGLISAAGTSLNFDSTDSALKPHNGFRSAFETEYAGIGGDFCFLRFAYINTYYKSPWRRGIFKIRADIKFIEPLWKTNSPNKIPITERFFLGGETSVRGYTPFSLGPLFSHNDDPQGGISSSLFSVEYLHEILSVLDGFVFFDMGNISLKRFHLGNYNMSYGVGVRCDALNRIPIIVGIGFPINPDHKSQVQKFFFSMGGQF
jgi:outer membrane protein insertion porin family